MLSPRHVALIPRSFPFTGGAAGAAGQETFAAAVADVKLGSRASPSSWDAAGGICGRVGEWDSVGSDRGQIATTRRAITAKKNMSHRDRACIHFLQVWCGESGNNTELLLCIVAILVLPPALAQQRQGPESNY